MTASELVGGVTGRSCPSFSVEDEDGLYCATSGELCSFLLGLRPHALALQLCKRAEGPMLLQPCVTF